MDFATVQGGFCAIATGGNDVKGSRLERLGVRIGIGPGGASGTTETGLDVKAGAGGFEL